MKTYGSIHQNKYILVLGKIIFVELLYFGRSKTQYKATTVSSKKKNIYIYRYIILYYIHLCFWARCTENGRDRL